MHFIKNPSNYSRFSGIYFLEDCLTKIKFNDIVKMFLGTRASNAIYSYGDILKQQGYNCFIGGEFLEDINVLRNECLSQPFKIKISSPDVLTNVVNELKQDSVEIPTAKGHSTHILNKNDNINDLLLYLCCRFGLLNKTTDYCLDLDGNHIENNKKDSRKSYQETYGYYPVVCSISGIPIYCENRNGNTPESFNQLVIIKINIEKLEARCIKLKKFRGDASYYELKTLEYLESKNILYYIRCQDSQRIQDAIADEVDWMPIVINNEKLDVCILNEKVLGKERKIVYCRRLLKNQGDVLFDQCRYSYQGIVTNDVDASPVEIIEFYNKRGKEGEHHFKDLNQDFGWNKLPYDNIEMNTIYMQINMIAYILFLFFRDKCAKQFEFVKSNMRLKNFTLHFVCLVGKWIKNGGRFVLKIFTDKCYKPIFATSG